MTSVLEQATKINLTVIDSNSRFIESKKYTVTYQMFSIAVPSDVLNHSQHQNSAFLKVNYFLHEVLDNAVAFMLEDMSHAERFLAEFDNHLMVLPDLDDMTLLEVIHRKLQTIAGEHTIINKLSLFDHDMKLTYHGYYEDDRTYNLPTQKEWCGEMSYWETPWWDRYDTLMFDNIADTQTEIDDHRTNVDLELLSQPYIDIDNGIDEMIERLQKGLSPIDDAIKTPAEIVSLDSAKKKKEAAWKPTLV